MKEKTIFISKKYANDFNNDKYNLSSGYYFRSGEKHDIAIVKYGEKDYLKNTEFLEREISSDIFFIKI